MLTYLNVNFRSNIVKVQLKIVFFSISSKLDPTSGEIAPANVSSSNNNKNIKTMVISAQITAATSMLEIVGNLAISATEISIAKFLGHATLILSIILYFVVLPYVIFMNTDKNRRMVIEDGWINLLKRVVCNNAFKIPVAGTNKVNPSPEENPHSAPGQQKNINIFIVSDNKIEESIPMQEALNTSATNMDMCMLEPSSSIGKQEDTSGDTIHNSSRKWNKVRREIIYFLLKSLKDETSYIENFKELVTFEDSMKQGENCAKCFIEEREEREREKTTYDFKVDRLKKLKNVQLECYEDEEEVRHERHTCSTFSGDIKDRTMLRKEAITRLLNHATDDEDVYKECFELFIDMEENFIN